MLGDTSLGVQGRGLKVLVFLNPLWVEFAKYDYIGEQQDILSNCQMVHHGVKCLTVWIENIPLIINLLQRYILPIIIRIIQVRKKPFILENVN